MGGKGYNPSYLEKVYCKPQKRDENAYVSLNINKRGLGGLGLDQDLKERHGSDFFLLTTFVTVRLTVKIILSLMCRLRLSVWTRIFRSFGSFLKLWSVHASQSSPLNFSSLCIGFLSVVKY